MAIELKREKKVEDTVHDDKQGEKDNEDER